jgi:hypothetical protein
VLAVLARAVNLEDLQLHFSVTSHSKPATVELLKKIPRSLRQLTVTDMGTNGRPEERWGPAGGTWLDLSALTTVRSCTLSILRGPHLHLLPPLLHDLCIRTFWDLVDPTGRKAIQEQLLELLADKNWQPELQRLHFVFDCVIHGSGPELADALQEKERDETQIAALIAARSIDIHAAQWSVGSMF